MKRNRRVRTVVTSIGLALVASLGVQGSASATDPPSDAAAAIVAAVEHAGQTPAARNPEVVPTHFEVNGTSLTQVVANRNGGFEYGITADPSWIWWTKNIATCVAQVASSWAGPAKIAAASAKIKKVAKSNTNVVKYGGNMIAEALGIGTCFTVVKEILE